MSGHVLAIPERTTEDVEDDVSRPVMEGVSEVLRVIAMVPALNVPGDRLKDAPDPAMHR